VTLSTGRVFRLWLPLAASWLLMGAELPLFTAFVARMADPEVQLAAYGSVVFPVALVVEGPVIMLLAASTALARDWPSFLRLRRFTLALAGGLTAVHVLVAFTPLFDVVAAGLIGAPEAVWEPARLGLRIMTPWTAAIAWRRFHQGVLIRHERSRVVAAGTVVRLVVLAAVLATGQALGRWPGIVVGSAAVALAVSAEALFIHVCVRPLLREVLRHRDPGGAPPGWPELMRFYVPLAMTPLLTLLIQPAGAAGMSRMPGALTSLAAWPAVHGLVFLFRSSGFAYNEVVVALLGEPGAARALRRFALLLGGGMAGLLLLVAATPLADLWFREVSGLSPELAAVSRSALLLAVLMPAYQAMQSWYQGALVHGRRTRGVTEAVALYLVVACAGLGLGVAWGRFPGIQFALVVFTTGGILQTLWLAWRARAVLRGLTAARG